MCGFLVPVALMYGINRLIDIQFLSNATQNFNCNISSATFISHYVLAVTWATTSIFMLIYVFVEIPHPKLDLQLLCFFSGALGIAMLWTECLTKPFPELLFRGIESTPCAQSSALTPDWLGRPAILPCIHGIGQHLYRWRSHPTLRANIR